MFKGIGKLNYGNTHAVLWIDQETTDYYLSLIPKARYVKRPRNAAHITVVRGGGEEPDILKKPELWGRHEGENIVYYHNGEVKNYGDFYVVHAFSERIGEIREELGLPRFRFQDEWYHFTVGNTRYEN